MLKKNNNKSKTQILNGRFDAIYFPFFWAQRKWLSLGYSKSSQVSFCLNSDSFQLVHAQTHRVNSWCLVLIPLVKWSRTPKTRRHFPCEWPIMPAWLLVASLIFQTNISFQPCYVFHKLDLAIFWFFCFLLKGNVEHLEKSLCRMPEALLFQGKSAFFP